MRQCKCEHWQQCPTCMPDRFDADGNLLPIPPTPLQACQSQVTALTNALFQAQEAAKGSGRVNAQLLEALEMIAGVRQCVDSLMSDKDIARAALAAAKEQP